MHLYYVPVSPKLNQDHPVFRNYPAARGASLSWPQAQRLHNLCTSDERVLRFHEDVFATLFAEVPLLGGLILLTGGESFYHCYMRPDLEGFPPDGPRTNCPVCAGRPPAEVVSRLIDRVATAVHKVKPAALITSWTYQPIRGDDAEATQLIAAYRPGTAHMVTVGKQQWYEKAGYRKLTWDYTLDFAGVSDLAAKQARQAAARGIPVTVKTETAVALELHNVPFVPSVPRWWQKWQSVASLHPIAVLQSWMFYGMWGSPAEELGKWTNWRPDLHSEEVRVRLAGKYYGNAATHAIAAWEACAEAVGHIPQIPGYFKGPEFLGPAHPLVLSPLGPEDQELYSGGLYYLQEHLETFSSESAVKRVPLILTELPAQPGHGFVASAPEKAWDIFQHEWAAAGDLFARALRSLQETPADLTARQHEQWSELQIIVEYLYRTACTTVNTYDFLREKARPEDGGVERIKTIARAELDNAQPALALYAKAPWLDLAERTDGRFPSSIRMLERKLELLEELENHVTLPR